VLFPFFGHAAGQLRTFDNRFLFFGSLFDRGNDPASFALTEVRRRSECSQLGAR
jgi:hypothetical protein